MPPIRSKSKAKKPESLIQQAPNAPVFEADSTPLLPLGAMLLAGSLSTAALAQTPASAPVAGTLGTVTVRDSATTDVHVAWCSSSEDVCSVEDGSFGSHPKRCDIHCRVIKNA